MTNQQTENVKALKARISYLQRELSHTRAQLLDYEEDGSYNELRRENKELKAKLNHLEGENLVLFELLTKTKDAKEKTDSAQEDKYYDSWFISNLKNQASKDDDKPKE
ncbi:hypothetical protein [Metabacillus hrfriensis]|uniref:Uncharacterized protein n=1 Tax=Metabacillus hrfriensis TaxID=3048891 RepID=A0ACD4REW1_9BACI|nr:hypothetical protein [Metabacillus sp. CT-WN-B3]UOK58870.1 hypothetical protein MGI18_07500 [Bacillus sp. OVS6]WHZ58936.1 hypothetical protein QLQ22_06250 [Metabacillus sp. CT-WN-B3]